MVENGLLLLTGEPYVTRSNVNPVLSLPYGGLNPALHEVCCLGLFSCKAVVLLCQGLSPTGELPGLRGSSEGKPVAHKPFLSAAPSLTGEIN